MRVLFSCNALFGHFYPLLPFARGLADAGHEVAFATSAYFSAVVEGAGFRHYPAGLDQTMEDLDPRLRTWVGPERAAFVHQEIFPGLYSQHVIPDLLALAATWRPDLIVREEVSYGGCIAAERLGIVHAAVDIYAAGEPSGGSARIAALLDGHRVACGLPPDPDGAMLHHYLTLHPFPPAFHDPSRPIPPTIHYVRHTPDDHSGPEGLPAWVASLPDRPVVYVGLGTVFNKPEIFRTVIAGLRDAALSLIVTVGRDQDPVDYGPQPENVHIERYIPLSLLLPHCDAVVTNGGSGTLLAALGQGLPVVVVPISSDQPRNAARCTALGVGRVIAPVELTPESARQAMLTVLGDPSYRQKAAQIRDEMAGLPGREDAVALLERLAVEKRPLVLA
jgi:UDP:flavonoid glycosyltransferase YjiC (YdhE family)